MRLKKLTTGCRYSNMLNKGVIPNSDLKKNSVSLTSTFKLNDKIKVSTSINYTNSGAKNRPAGNRGANPMQALYETNSHIDVLSLRDYWEKGKEGIQQNGPYALEVNSDGTYSRGDAH